MGVTLFRASGVFTERTSSVLIVDIAWQSVLVHSFERCVGHRMGL